MRAVSALILVGAACACPVGNAAAGKSDDRPVIFAANDRDAVGGRAVQVTLEQREIATSVDLGRIAPMDTGGGGLLGTAIIGSLDDRAKLMTDAQIARAEASARPLRRALIGFDVARLALNSIKAALGKVTWLGARDVIENDQSLAHGRATFLATTSTSQVVFITYRYDLSPDFTQIRVIADVSIERREARQGATPTVFRQTLTSIAQLATRSYEPSENVARWSADNGALARRALTAAFIRLETLLPFALDLRPEQVAGFVAKTRDKVFAGGYYGALIERGPRAGDGLLWNNRLIAVQTLP